MPSCLGTLKGHEAVGEAFIKTEEKIGYMNLLICICITMLHIRRYINQYYFLYTCKRKVECLNHCFYIGKKKSESQFKVTITEVKLKFKLSAPYPPNFLNPNFLNNEMILPYLHYCIMLY